MILDMHTSGPWKVYHAKLRPQFSGRIIEVQDDHGKPVVTWSGFDNYDRLKKTHLANARLIAAAPEMLNALIAALPLLRQAATEEARANLAPILTSSKRFAAKERLAVAETAITKAVGKKP